MKDRKQIAQLLDRAAARADMVGAAPATSKQCWFLAGLLAAAYESRPQDRREIDEMGASSFVLSKSRASHLIDLYK